MADSYDPNLASPTATGSTAPAVTLEPPAPRSGIERLAKMSTTAGVGTGDYAALNNLAIIGFAVALLLGGLAFLSWLMLGIPAAALVCGVVALRQIGQSNGTQTGRFWAWGAVVISLGILGFVVGGWAVQNVKTKPDREAILAAVGAFDKAMADGDPAAAYRLTSPAFQQRVTEKQWVGTFAEFERVPELGAVTGVSWNGVPVLFDDPVENQPPTASVTVLFKYRKGGDPGRVPVGFSKTDGKWTIGAMPTLFRPPAKGKGRDQQDAGAQ
ncbi:MAG: hypothetical protein JWO31_3484 [Phycisphaerales bacterium]|nr:hypothetical protein [Phycisphaerales bacterium]